jgi:hypothetical protein
MCVVAGWANLAIWSGGLANVLRMNRSRGVARPLAHRGALVGILVGVALSMSSSDAVGASRAHVHIAAALTASGGSAHCPLKPSSTIPSGEAWAFTTTGPPSTSSPGLISTYAHGRGTWSGGRGRGTICRQDTRSGSSRRDIVLSVVASAHVSPRITRLGRLGVGLVLSVTVSASDDTGCSPGARGTVTLFASYYEGHRDSIQFHFAAACASYDATYLGPRVYTLIARNGRQVNHA